ncbi:helicase-related protein, partial [Singulisphaera rosea]
EIDRLRDRLDRYRETESGVDLDRMAELEELIAAGSAGLSLMGGEEHRLRELIAAAERVERETRIERIVELVRTRFPGRSVLFFTEYKATQSLLISALFREFGDGCATFINGDGQADGVADSTGRVITIREPRERAADRFNEGTVRFLVSTEAAGEGIDLQDHCHTLVHVDIPWNPMRMHQRVGRLNRIGQQRPVEVVIIRNPDTVEGRIWDKLNAKIESIMRALGGVMEQPEDLMELVLGMAAPSLFTELYSEAGSVRTESLSDWFDGKTARFGGRDAIATV